MDCSDMNDPHGESICYEKRGRLGLVTLNRPQTLNSLVPDMLDQFKMAVDAAVADPAVMCIAVTGAGKGFCAGADLAQVAKDAKAGTVWDRPADAEHPAGELPLLFSHLLQAPKPVIALINGPAAGGGFVLAMMSDLRFAAEGAFLTTAFSRIGLVAEHGMSWLLPRQVGISRALDLLWTSRRLTAQEALEMGLLDRVLPGDDLIQAAVEYAESLAAVASPRAVAEMKAQVYADFGRSIEAAAPDIFKRMVAALTSSDAAEASLAMSEQRPPVFDAYPGKSQ